MKDIIELQVDLLELQHDLRQLHSRDELLQAEIKNAQSSQDYPPYVLIAKEAELSRLTRQILSLSSKIEITKKTINEF